MDARNLNGVSTFFLWHEPWSNGKQLIDMLGFSIISIMDLYSRARLSTVLNDGDWNFSPTNYVLASGLRHNCSATTLRTTDSITWDN